MVRPGSTVPLCARKPRSGLALLVALAAGCDGGTREPGASEPERVREPGRPPPSLLLITLDTTRADALSCLGGPEGLTPALDALAREAIVFENARSVAPLTLPSHASMLTGLYPPRHGLRDNTLGALPAEAATVAEAAAAAGIDSAAFVAAIVLGRAFGLDQGFAHWDEPVKDVAAPPDSHFDERPASAVVDRFLAWWRMRDTSRRFFAWTHFFDPHVPYRPSREMLRRARGHLYHGEIAEVDAQIRRLLDEMGPRALESTIVIVVGDHGEGLGEHGENSHGSFCWDSTLRVPLIVRLPGGERAGERSGAVVSVVDVAPTALDALGLPIPEGIDGRSLLREIPAGRGVYFESFTGWLNFGWSPLAGWVDDARKYLHSARPVAIDLRADPRELAPIEVEPGADGAARAAIGEVIAAPSLSRAPDGAVDEETLERLKALGYAVFGGARVEIPSPLQESDLPSPHDRLDELARFLQAERLVNERKPAEARALLEEIVAENPAHANALGFLAFLDVADRDFASARVRLERVIALGRDRAVTHLNLGYCLEDAGDLEGAQLQYEICLEMERDYAKAKLGLERVRSRLDRGPGGGE